MSTAAERLVMRQLPLCKTGLKGTEHALLSSVVALPAVCDLVGGLELCRWRRGICPGSRAERQTSQVRTVSFVRNFGEGGTFSVAYGNDGKLLVTSKYEGSGWVPLRIYDPSTGEVTTLLPWTGEFATLFSMQRLWHRRKRSRPSRKRRFRLHSPHRMRTMIHSPMPLHRNRLTVP